MYMYDCTVNKKFCMFLPDKKTSIVYVPWPSFEFTGPLRPYPLVSLREREREGGREGELKMKCIDVSYMYMYVV